MGFQKVYDYVPGKVDWLAHALPSEGDSAHEARAAAHIRNDVVTAQLTDRMGDVAQRVGRSPYGFAFVVSPGGVLLGRLRKAALDGDADAVAEAVMESGPSTVRPDAAMAKLAKRMQKANLTTMVVSTPEGVLLGLLRRDDADRVAGGVSGTDAA